MSGQRAEAREQIESARAAAAEIRKQIEANEAELVDILAGRIARLFTDAQELNSAVALLLEMRKRSL